MSFERNLIISLLKKTREGPVLIESVNIDARLPSSTSLNLLRKLQYEGLVYLRPGFVEADYSSRIKLAIKAVSLGADIEHISNFLCWQEFENLASIALKNNRYIVQQNVRFKHAGRKWEIDAVGFKKPIVICIDCKHWHHGLAPSALKRIVNSQVERTKALAESLPNVSLRMECTKWSKAKFIPGLLSLIPSAFKFYNKVPVVPILQLQDFLNQLPAYTESLKLLPKTFNTLSDDFQN